MYIAWECFYWKYEYWILIKCESNAIEKVQAARKYQKFWAICCRNKMGKLLSKLCHLCIYEFIIYRVIDWKMLIDSNRFDGLVSAPTIHISVGRLRSSHICATVIRITARNGLLDCGQYREWLKKGAHLLTLHYPIELCDEIAIQTIHLDVHKTTDWYVRDKYENCRLLLFQKIHDFFHLTWQRSRKIKS